MPHQARSSPDKASVREAIWGLLQREHLARFPGAHGRIPNFIGAERAADLLADQREWRRAQVVKANPDAPQLPVRARAFAEGKRLYMAVPRLRSARPFVLLDPERLNVTPRAATSISGSSRYGRAVAIGDMARIDLIVCGPVAINRRGVRVGKGGGYSDLEFALLREAGLVDDDTTIATTVHDRQLVDDALPETAHDFRVDLIVTPTTVLRPGRARRPRGVIWSDLDDEKIAAIPALARHRGATGRRGRGSGPSAER